MDKQVDVLIIGGGLTGATLMLALANQGLRTLLVEANAFNGRDNAGFDARSLALAPASIRILQTLRVWPLLKDKATPINSIYVSEQYSFGGTRLHKTDAEPLGYVAEMQHINAILQQLINKQDLLTPARLIALDPQQGIARLASNHGEINIKAGIIVAADGANSTVRQLSGMTAISKDYNQHAIIANIGLARAHQFKAYERFTAAGPLALLPMTNRRAALIWALKPEEANRLMAVNEGQFLLTLQQQFGYKLGRLVKAGQRTAYPLRQVLMPQPIAWPIVFVGNAAHTLHPVAGQGFNLGLRDVAALAQCIIQQGLTAAMMRNYQALREYDQRIIASFTDGLIHLFTNSMPGVGLARNFGLLALDNLSLLKNSFARYARGFAGHCPDLVCGITPTRMEQP